MYLYLNQNSKELEARKIQFYKECSQGKFSRNSFLSTDLEHKMLHIFERDVLWTAEEY